VDSKVARSGLLRREARFMDGTSEWKRDLMVAKGVVVEAVRRVAVVFSVDMWVGRGMLVMGVKADMIAQQLWLLDRYTAEPALIRLSKILLSICYLGLVVICAGNSGRQSDMISDHLQLSDWARSRFANVVSPKSKRSHHPTVFCPLKLQSQLAGRQHKAHRNFLFHKRI
jgi:hypothetical protein